MEPVDLLPAPPRTCASCDGGMDGKRPHAVYCTRKCKASASEKRRPPRDDAARYLSERDHRLEYAREYQRNNPQVPQRAKRKRKAHMAGAGIFTVSSRDWAGICTRFNNRCFYCESEGVMTMDHVVPVSRGGRHSIGNLVPACKTCNSSKRDRTIMEWRLKLPSPRQRSERERDARATGSNTSTSALYRANLA